MVEENARRPIQWASYSQQTDTPPQDLPLLRRWMRDAPGHLLRRLMERPSRYPGVVRVWWRDPVLTTVEEMLVIRVCTVFGVTPDHGSST